MILIKVNDEGFSILCSCSLRLCSPLKASEVEERLQLLWLLLNGFLAVLLNLQLRTKILRSERTRCTLFYSILGFKLVTRD